MIHIQENIHALCNSTIHASVHPSLHPENPPPIPFVLPVAAEDDGKTSGVQLFQRLRNNLIIRCVHHLDHHKPLPWNGPICCWISGFKRTNDRFLWVKIGNCCQNAGQQLQYGSLGRFEMVEFSWYWVLKVRIWPRCQPPLRERWAGTSKGLGISLAIGGMWSSGYPPAEGLNFCTVWISVLESIVSPGHIQVSTAVVCARSARFMEPYSLRHWALVILPWSPMNNYH